MAAEVRDSANDPHAKWCDPLRSSSSSPVLNPTLQNRIPVSGLVATMVFVADVIDGSIVAAGSDEIAPFLYPICTCGQGSHR